METTKGATLEGDKLKLDIELDLRGHLSGSGKSMVLATTNGFTQIQGTDIMVSYNIIRKR